MDVPDLRRQVASLKQFVQHHLRKQVEEQVFNDLADEPTINYIKSLEDQKDRYQANLREEVKKNKELRVAMQSQARLLEKLKKLRVRPASAQAGPTQHTRRVVED